MLHRRLTRDHETDPEVSEHMIRWAAINGTLGRRARVDCRLPAPGTDAGQHAMDKLASD
jgi:hypothetical protein